MCDICWQSPCAIGCPNAPEPESIGICKACSQEIVTGEQYAELGQRLYHLDCVEDMDVSELLKLVHVEICTAAS